MTRKTGVGARLISALAGKMVVTKGQTSPTTLPPEAIKYTLNLTETPIEHLLAELIEAKRKVEQLEAALEEIRDEALWIAGRVHFGVATAEDAAFVGAKSQNTMPNLASEHKERMAVLIQESQAPLLAAMTDLSKAAKEIEQPSTVCVGFESSEEKECAMCHSERCEKQVAKNRRFLAAVANIDLVLKEQNG